MNYYSASLNASRLQKCYEVAPPRVQRFLEAEIAFVLGRISPGDQVLDLGCGYGRVTFRLAAKAQRVVGIDISPDNIRLARKLAGHNNPCEFFEMDAAGLQFKDHAFDLVICIQNGISAFKTDPAILIKEAIRVTRPKGTVLFSSYSDKFWDHRLEWFRIQAGHGLIGEIDEDLTKNGTIVCKDGFRAITFSGDEFLTLASGLHVHSEIHEVDDSIVFCEMVTQ